MRALGVLAFWLGALSAAACLPPTANYGSGASRRSRLTREEMAAEWAASMPRPVDSLVIKVPCRVIRFATTTDSTYFEVSCRRAVVLADSVRTP